MFLFPSGFRKSYRLWL